MSVVVVGKNSFLAGHVKTHPECAHWIYLNHAKIDDAAIKTAETVINFAFAPSLTKDEYDTAQDIDTRLAKSIGKNTQYIMLSSRMVYGESKAGAPAFNEHDEPNPANPYGRNKLAIENSLRSILPENRLTVLRLSNIFGYEPGRHTFFGIALENLRRNKKMVFDHARETVRDFLPVEIFAERLAYIVNNPQPGTYNLGSGFGLRAGILADTLIEHYGEGAADFTSAEHKGAFYLDMQKTNAAFGFDKINEATVLEYVSDRARRLRLET